MEREEFLRRPNGRERILVVDDNEELRELCAEMLEIEGYDVVQAASGREAILRAEASRPGVVLTDLGMPGMSGLELCDYFRHEYPPPVPSVVVMSAIGGAEAEARRKAASAFLLKPFGLDELLSAVRDAAEGTSRADEAAAERHEAEREHARAAARAMAEAAVAAASASEPEAFDRTLHVARWLGGFFEDASVTLFLPSDGQLAPFASNDGRLDATRSPLRAVAQTVLDTGSTLIIPDVADQPWLGLPADDLGAVIAVPFRYRGVAIGALCLVSPQTRELGAADAAILEHIAAQAATRFTATRVPFLGRSGLISRNSFRRILAIEATAAAERGEAIAIVLLRVPVEASLGALLEELPAGRTLVGELQEDAIAIATRGPHDRARGSARACAAFVHARGGVEASAELVIGPPVPPISDHELLAWAERLLVDTSETPGRAHVVVDTHAIWARP